MVDDGEDPDTDKPDSDDPSSLYDPPSEEGYDDVDRLADEEVDEDHEVLHLDIPKDLARQLLEVANHLGLTPSLVASRAIGLVCDEIGTVDDDPLSTNTLIQQFQARLDILHVLEEADVEEEKDPTWEEVDEIIQAAKQNEA